MKDTLKNSFKKNQINQHIMHINNQPFLSILQGKKTIEMRLYDEKRQQLKKNDEIIFINKTNKNKLIKTKIKELHICKSFNELYHKFDKINLGYNHNENAYPSDMEKFYSREDIEKFGVVGIEIELL